jgi:prepilin-type N-terminal cleavage/methylation domain-containing protein
LTFNYHFDIFKSICLINYSFYMKNLFNNSKKQAFTLIELSIVLLVLAFLVAGVLISRTIIDRARGQSIINDFDNMKKATILFYDTFGALPGDISVNRLLESSIFNYTCADGKVSGKFPYSLSSTNCTGGIATNASYPHIGSVTAGNLNQIVSVAGTAVTTCGTLHIVASGIGCTSATSANTNVAANLLINPLTEDGYISPAESCFAMRQLDNAGFIAGVPNAALAGGTTNIKSASDNPDTVVKQCHYGKFADLINNTKKAKFSSDVAIMLVSFDSSTLAGGAGAFFHEILATGSSLGVSSDTDYYKTNMIFMIGAVPADIPATTSATAKYVDLKYDDGLPYTGKLVATRYPAEYLTGSIMTADNNTQYCTTLRRDTTGYGTYTAAGLTSASIQAANAYQNKAPNSASQGCNLAFRIGTL